MDVAAARDRDPVRARPPMAGEPRLDADRGEVTTHRSTFPSTGQRSGAVVAFLVRPAVLSSADAIGHPAVGPSVRSRELGVSSALLWQPGAAQRRLDRSAEPWPGANASTSCPSGSARSWVCWPPKPAVAIEARRPAHPPRGGGPHRRPHWPLQPARLGDEQLPREAGPGPSATSARSASRWVDLEPFQGNTTTSTATRAGDRQLKQIAAIWRRRAAPNRRAGALRAGRNSSCLLPNLPARARHRGGRAAARDHPGRGDVLGLASPAGTGREGRRGAGQAAPTTRSTIAPSARGRGPGFVLGPP